MVTAMNAKIGVPKADVFPGSENHVSANNHQVLCWHPEHGFFQDASVHRTL